VELSDECTNAIVTESLVSLGGNRILRSASVEAQSVNDYSSVDGDVQRETGCNQQLQRAAL